MLFGSVPKVGADEASDDTIELIVLEAIADMTDDVVGAATDGAGSCRPYNVAMARAAISATLSTATIVLTGSSMGFDLELSCSKGVGYE